MMTDAELLDKLMRHLSFRLVPNDDGSMQLGLALAAPRALIIEPWTDLNAIKRIVEASVRYSPASHISANTMKGH